MACPPGPRANGHSLTAGRAGHAEGVLKLPAMQIRPCAVAVFLGLLSLLGLHWVGMEAPSDITCPSTWGTSMLQQDRHLGRTPSEADPLTPSPAAEDGLPVLSQVYPVPGNPVANAQMGPPWATAPVQAAPPSLATVPVAPPPLPGAPLASAPPPAGPVQVVPVQVALLLPVSPPPGAAPAAASPALSTIAPPAYGPRVETEAATVVPGGAPIPVAVDEGGDDGETAEAPKKEVEKEKEAGDDDLAAVKEAAVDEKKMGGDHAETIEKQEVDVADGEDPAQKAIDAEKKGAKASGRKEVIEKKEVVTGDGEGAKQEPDDDGKKTDDGDDSGKKTDDDDGKKTDDDDVGKSASLRAVKEAAVDEKKA